MLESAVANAEHNHELDADELHIVKAFVDEGPTLKRWRPRAKGRATQILKRTSHITVVVSDVPAKEISRNSAATSAQKGDRLMGQKVHPESMRVGYIHDWKSNWYNEKHFAEYLIEDVNIREHIFGRLAHAGLSKVTIKKNASEVTVNIHTARPGIVIGKSGSEVDALRRTCTS